MEKGQDRALAHSRHPSSADATSYNGHNRLPSTSSEATLHEQASQRDLSNQTPIVDHYLTFETSIPTVTNPLALTEDGSPPPEPPDLLRYRSPLTWSSTRKNTVIFLACVTSTFVTYAAGSYNAASHQLQSQFGISQTVSYLGITLYTTGFAIAPMVLAPFSEINGRKPVFIATGILFAVGQLGCAVTDSFAGLLVARFFVGAGGSTFSSTVGGVIGDVYNKEHRNTPMALMTGLALFGTGLGPLCSGFLAQHLSWRWVFWVQVITCGVCALAVSLFFEETRGSVLLSRKAKTLNKWYEARETVGLFGVDMPVSMDGYKTEIQRIRWKVKSDEERETLGKMVAISLYRPLHLLITEPVVFFFSLWHAVTWGVLYLTFSMVPLVFSTSHNFTVAQNGAVFAAMCIASLIQTPISIYQETAARHWGAIPSSPEGRLYFTCIQSALLPISLFWFGWTSGASVPWIVPTLAIGVLTMGVMSIYLAGFNYLADTYHRFASSALAAQSFCRNLLAGVFPLVADAMFERMTFPGASSFLGAVSLVLTLVPWVLVVYGPRIRARSKVASEILRQ